MSAEKTNKKIALGLRTTIYKVPDLQAGKSWYEKAFNTEAYFDEPFYVGLNIGGYELGLLPYEETDQDAPPKADNILSYWGVEDIHSIYQHFIDAGALEHQAPTNVGGELMVASVRDPWNNVIGLIYNPAFQLKD